MKKERAGGVALFGDKKIRRVLVDNEWWFSVVDVCGVLTESKDPNNYWKVLKNRLKNEASQSVTNCNQLKFLANDGKYYLSDATGITCKNIEKLTGAKITSPNNFLGRKKIK